MICNYLFTPLCDWGNKKITGIFVMLSPASDPRILGTGDVTVVSENRLEMRQLIYLHCLHVAYSYAVG